MSTMTVARSAHPIEFIVEADPKGHVNATVPISWRFDDEAMKFIAEQRAEGRMPYLLLVTAGVRQRAFARLDYSEADKALKENEALSSAEYDALIKEVHETRRDYSVMSVQVIELFKGTRHLNPAKAFAVFGRPGRNVLVGRLVAMGDDTAEKLRKWSRHPMNLLDLEEDSDSGLKIEAYEFRQTIMERGFGTSYVSVEVPDQMFAKEPPRALKTLVSQYFYGREDDQCHFRKRLIASILLTIPVQFYGLFVRLGTLLIAAVFLACRDTFTSEIFALNPHDYPRSIGSSWWYKDRNGRERPLWRRVLSPLGLVMIAAAFVVSFWPGMLVLALLSLFTHSLSYDFWTLWLVGWATDAVIAIAFFACWFSLNDKGRAWFERHVAPLVAQRNAGESIAAQPFQRSPEEMAAVISQLQHAQAETRAPSQMANATFRLKFLDLKAKVCRPFAK